MIHVNAEITIVEGKLDEFLKEFHQIVPQVRQEDGCIKYYPCLDLPTDIKGQEPVRPLVVTVRESWESVPALEAHLKAPHMEEFRARVKEMVTGISLRVYEPSQAPAND